MKPKLLITGASGFLGYHLLRLAVPHWEVYGIVNKGSINTQFAQAVTCNIANYIDLGNCFEDIEPNAVIHTAALTDANYCQQHKDESYLVNVESTRNIAGMCCDLQIPFAFTSTDLVFDGKRGLYKEEDEKNPLNIYGEHKSVAEEEILKIYSQALILRLPLMFGLAEATERNYLRNFIAALKEGKTTNLFVDEFRSVAGAKSIATGMLNMLGHCEGIMHLAGGERLSRYDFGLKIAEAFNLATGSIKSCLQKDMKMEAPRPADVSLNIDKARKLGYEPMTVNEELRLIAANHYL